MSARNAGRALYGLNVGAKRRPRLTRLYYGAKRRPASSRVVVRGLVLDWGAQNHFTFIQ
jgi:hypothetical protein